MVMMANERFENNKNNGTMVDDSDAIADYRQSLSELVFNSKPMILMLTMLADDNKDSNAAEIVHCIEQRLYQVESDKKLPTLYLIDSICKNLTTSTYAQLFERKIVKLFCHAFERFDEKNRLALFKLRQTWSTVFDASTLRTLDVAVKKLDNNWPIINAVSSKPKVECEQPLPPPTKLPPPPPSSIDQVSHIEQNDSKRKTAPPPPPPLSANLAKPNTLRDANFLFQKSNNVNKKSINKCEKNNKRKMNSVSSGATSSSSSAKIRKKDSNDRMKNIATAAAAASNPTSQMKKSKGKKRKTSPNSQGGSTSAKLLKKNSIDASAAASIALPIAPDDVIPLGQNHHKSVTKWSKPEVRPPPPQPPVVKSKPPPPQKTDPVGFKKSTTQTNIPAPNVFTQPEMLFGYPTNSSPSQPTSWNSQPEPQSFGTMDRDYRQEFDTLVSEAQTKLNAGDITSADHELLIREAEKQYFEMQNNHHHQPQQQGFQPPPPQQHPPPPPILEPHGSVKLFINNEMRRLYYLDNIISLVAMKVHPETPFDQLINCDPLSLEPKQVYFSGMTTTVFIDQGQPSEFTLRLEFNQLHPFTFYFPGSANTNTIMLGLPARELIVNGRPYQVAFGGPPIKVYFESDASWHTFALSDSRPLLKFSDEIRCDLWIRLVNDAKVKAGIPVNPAQPNNYYPPPVNPPYNYPPNPTYDAPPAQLPPPAEVPKIPDLNNLLSKLTAVGLINANPTPANEVGGGDSGGRVGGGGRGSKKSRRQKQRERRALNEPRRYLPLDVSTLKVHHQFAIDQLYSGVQCTNCSLRFSDEALKDENGKKSRYARHLDWHFRQNRRDKAKPGSVGSSNQQAHRRPWCYTSESWIIYREVYDDVEDDSTGFFDNSTNSPSMPLPAFNFDFSQFKDQITDFDTFLEIINCDSNSAQSGQPKQCSVVSGSDSSLNNCTVCNEAFDLKWNEEEEEWRLMNAVMFGGEGATGRAFHPLCLKDHLMQQEKATTEPDNCSIEDNATVVSRKVSVIPGLDSVEDVEMNETSLTEEVVKAEVQEESNETVEQPEVQTEIEDEIKDEPIVKQEEEENFEVKVVEFEIPIGLLKSESTSSEECHTTEANTNQSVDEECDASDEVKPTESTTTNNITKPKRGGIVIKMKKSTNNNTTTAAAAVAPPSTVSSDTAVSGNVLPNDDSSSSVVEIKTTDQTDNNEEKEEPRCSANTNINSPNKRINIIVNNVGDGETVVEEEEEAVEASMVEVDELKPSSPPPPSPSAAGVDVQVEDNVGDLESRPDPGTKEPSSQPEQANYFSRGREESSLCSIM